MNQQYSYNANGSPLSQNEMEKDRVNSAKRRYDNAKRMYVPNVNINGSQTRKLEGLRYDYERKLKNYKKYLNSKGGNSKGGSRRRSTRKSRSTRMRKSRRV
jgi:hypothetical protein